MAAKTKELKDGWAALNKAKEELEAGQKKYDAGLAQYNEKLEQYNAGRAALEAKKADYNKAKQGVAMLGGLYGDAAPLVKACQDAEAAGDDEAKQTALENMAPLNVAIQGNPALQAMGITDCFKLVGAYNQMQTGIKEYEDNKALLDKAEQDLTAGKQLLDENKLKLDAGRKVYEEGLKKAENGELQLAQGQAALTGSAARLEAGKARLSAAESELKAGREKLAEFEAGEKKIKAAEAEMKKNEDIKMNLAQNPSLSLAEAFRKALDDATVKTTKELTTRASILGAVGLAAAILFIAGVFGLFSKPLGALALIGAALSIFALIFTFMGERGITPLQIAAAAALTVAGVVYFPAGKFAKAPVKAAR